MPEKSADEFHTGNGKSLLDTGFIVTSKEGDHISIDRNNSGVGDSDFVGIASKILNGVTVAIESLLDETVPIHRIKLIAEKLPMNWVF